jgi:AraC-like DNA-binding protein
MSIFEGVRIADLEVAEIELTARWCAVVPESQQTYLYFVIDGCCWLDAVGLNAPIELHGGDIVTLVAGQRHVWRDSLSSAAVPTSCAGKHDGATRLLVSSAPRNSNAFVAVYPALVVVPSSEEPLFPQIHQLTRLLHLENSADREGKHVVLTRLSELIVIELIRYALPRMPLGGRNWLGGMNDRQIGKAIALMHNDIAREWTLSALAKEVGLSRAVFAERFTRLVGEPPNRYLRRIRIQGAAIKLERSAWSIVEIAESVGYQSESAFNKAFSKELNITPARYRSARRAA